MMEITYLAGLFDGEGCINIQKSDNNSGSPGYVLNIQINQIYQKTLLEITQCFGGRFHTRLRKDGKIVSIWICSGSKAIEVLKLMLPYLREKKEQADLALSYSENYALQ